MSKYFASSKSPFRIDLDDGQWIEIKNKMSWDDQQVVFNGQKPYENKKLEDEIKTLEADLKTLKGAALKEAQAVLNSKKAIYQREEHTDTINKLLPVVASVLLDWSFIDDNGQKVPCDAENLKDVTLEFLTDAVPKIMAHYGPEKKSSQPSEPELPEGSKTVIPETQS